MVIMGLNASAPTRAAKQRGVPQGRRPELSHWLQVTTHSLDGEKKHKVYCILQADDSVY